MSIPMAMRGPTRRAQDFRGSTRRLWRMLRPERFRISATVVLTIGNVAGIAAGPMILGDAVNTVFAGVIGRTLPSGLTEAQAIAYLRSTGRGPIADMLAGMDVVPGQGVDFTVLGRELGVVALIFVGSWLFGSVSARITATVVQRTVLRLREQAESKLARMPLSYFDSQTRGELLSRVTLDVDNLGQTMQQTLSQIIGAVLTIAGLLAVMLWVSWLLALIAVITVPASVVITARIARRAKPQFGAQWTTTGMLNGHIEETYTGYELVRVFGRQRETAETFRQQNRTLYQASFKAQFVSGLIAPAMTLLGNLNYALVVVVGCLRIAAGAISLGAVQAFLQYSRRFSQSLSQLASVAGVLQSGVASFERVHTLLEAPEQEPDPAAAPKAEAARGRVCFENVSFSYLADEALIEDLSLVAEPGTTVAIVGPTGAGKTTIVNLLMRFYDVTGGRITLDGADIATLPRDRVRAQIGMVLQDAWLFAGTIAENIAYGAHGATHDQIVAAARAAHADQFIRTLPDGYDTVIDDGAETVSTGERQLITIARAFLAEPSILVLDEATSSVDTRTDVLIQHAMGELRRGRTSFVIAHRLSTIRDADLILVMAHGRIAERGTHKELMAASGTYRRMHDAQFGRIAVQGPSAP